MKKFPDDPAFPLRYAYLTTFTNERTLGQMMLWRVGQVNPEMLKDAGATVELRSLFPIPAEIAGKAKDYFDKLMASGSAAEA